MTSPPLFAVEDLVIEGRKAGGWTPIVDRVGFTVNSGEVVALIGESGSGKTTLGLAALGYLRPGCRHVRGRVLLEGVDFLALDIEERRRLRGAKVAYLAQSPAAAFNPSRTIGEQVTESARIHGILSSHEAEARALALYRTLELPDPQGIGRRYPHEVSGGQLQRLMAAMALCGGPSLLVLDEPTTALDVTTQIEVLQAFKRVIRTQGTAAIYITHDLALVAQIADRVVVLRNGSECESGAVSRIIESPRNLYTKQLLAAVHPVRAVEPRGITETPLLQVEGLSAGYGPQRNGTPRIKVLTGIDLVLRRGETLGVIGESGCGKSTLARVIAGAMTSSEGRVVLDGTPLPPLRKRRSREQLRRIQFVFQMADTALNPRQKVAEILGRPLRLYRRLKGPARRDKVRELLKLVGLSPELEESYPPELSGGQKQRLNLARALAAEPDVVLCDEVTSALDVVVGAAVIELLKRLRRDLGVSYLFISHDLSTVAGFSDRIAVLYAGRVVEQGPAAAVLSPPYHPYTQLLVASSPELRIGWLDDTLSKRATRAGVGKGVTLGLAGCPFHPRCPQRINGLCDIDLPPIREVATGHRIACHLTLADLSKDERRGTSRSSR